jgi:hypothetical protein
LLLGHSKLDYLPPRTMSRRIRSPKIEGGWMVAQRDIGFAIGT